MIEDFKTLKLLGVPITVYNGKLGADLIFFTPAGEQLIYLPCDGKFDPGDEAFVVLFLRRFLMENHVWGPFPKTCADMLNHVLTCLRKDEAA